ncbi:hypothetical protein N836_24525 [Leptolyngbya sp. Heron Island J]|nr:hypothetical protein N836_24525 [Leptolyngbya sp. Heron Island J]
MRSPNRFEQRRAASTSQSDKVQTLKQAIVELYEFSSCQEALPEISESMPEPRDFSGAVAFRRQLTKALLTLIAVVAVVAALKSDAKTILDSLLPLLAFILGYYFPH